jgi:hypothetical protein
MHQTVVENSSPWGILEIRNVLKEVQRKAQVIKSQDKPFTGKDGIWFQTLNYEQTAKTKTLDIFFMALNDVSK